MLSEMREFPKVPLSAVLITLNAETYLDAVLSALSFCDEILILDSGSTDGSREIAQKFGARWECREFSGYGPQKRAAVALARHDWILSLDADEVLEEDCAEAIAGLDWNAMDPRDCWRIRRRPFVGKREIRHGHWVPDRVVRLFSRTHHNFSPDLVHESVHPKGKVHDLPGAMRHFSYESPADLFRLDYARLKAEQIHQQGRRPPGAFRLAIRADWAFFHSLIIRRGILDGPVGVLIALSAAFNATMGFVLAHEAALRKDED